MPLVHLVKIGLTLAAKYLMDPHFGRFDDSIEIDKNPSEPPDPGSTHGAPTDGHEGGQSDVIYSFCGKKRRHKLPRDKQQRFWG
jgi:hypothetical protein